MLVLLFGSASNPQSVMGIVRGQGQSIMTAEDWWLTKNSKSDSIISSMNSDRQAVEAGGFTLPYCKLGQSRRRGPYIGDTSQPQQYLPCRG